MNKFIYALALAGCAALSQPAVAETVRLCSPADHTIFGISDNGHWAVGVQGNAMSEMYAFRWNLLTNEIEVSTVPSMCGTSIADDGTYCGGFNYTDESGRTTVQPGYFDGTWHLLPTPEGTVKDALDGAISPDGRHMALTLELDGVYTGVQYEDNKLVRVLKSSDHARVYDITDDGSKTCGWTYAHINGKVMNRTGVYWEGDSDYKIIDRDPSKPESSPWAGVRRFSTDGNYALYYGGWTVPAQQGDYPYVESIKNLATGDITPVYAVDAVGEDFQLNDFSDDMKVVGSYNYMACIADGGKTYYLVDWLKDKKGIDAKADWNEVMTTEGGAFLLTGANCISHDSKAIGLMYNGTDMEMHSMVVRFDVTIEDCPPVTVKASEVTKALAARIDWVMPYGMDMSKVKGYNVYRNGTKVNQVPVACTYYYDTNLEAGKEYSYQIAAIYDKGESELSTAANITLVGSVPEQPASVVARQKGYNSVALTWEEPYTNLVRKYYYDDESLSEGFGTSELNTTAEAGIKFTAEELALYGNAKISGVEFYPMSKQQDWKVTLYSENATDGKLTKLAQHKVSADNLKIGERTLFTLPEAVAVPAGQNLIAAVSVTVVDEAQMQNAIGMQFGKVTKGYSDLLRRVIVPPEDFKSLVDMSVGSSANMQVSWKIGVILTPEGSPADIDKVDSYVLARDGKEVYNGREMKYVDANMAEGTYNYDLTAVYSDGRKSQPVKATQKVATRADEAYAAQDVTVVTADGNVNVTWKAPEDTDLTDVTWAHGNKSNTKITAANNNYNLQAAAIYSPSMFKGLSGYNIVGAKFFPTCDATYTIIVDNGTKTAELACYEVGEYKQGEWNTVYFDEPVALDASKRYRMIVDCYDVEDNGSPLAVDDSMGVDGFSCLINVTTDEEVWQEVSAAIGKSTNWMLGLLLADPNPTALPVKGYDVKLDGKKLNEAMVTETKYSYPVASIGGNENKPHKMTVDTWYEPATTAVPGVPVTFTIAGSGIDETFVADLNVTNDGAILRVSTAMDVALYDMNGVKVASAEGDSVRIDELATGIYVVKAATAEGKTIVTKVNIRR